MDPRRTAQQILQYKKQDTKTTEELDDVAKMTSETE
jgi:hypothetical protein